MRQIRVIFIFLIMNCAMGMNTFRAPEPIPARLPDSVPFEERVTKAYEVARKYGTEKLLDYALRDKDGKISQPVIQTAWHMLVNPWVLSPYDNQGNRKQVFIAREYVEQPELWDLFTRAITKEKELSKQYYTFYHGQRKAYYWPEKLYTFLWGMARNEPTKDFFFAHVKKMRDPENYEEFEEEDVNRVLILNANPASPFYFKRTFRDDLYRKILYTNYAFFGNDVFLDSSTAALIAKNYNWDAPQITPKIAAQLTNFEWVYKQFKDEIEEINNQYNALSGYGNVLLVAMPKDKIQEYMFVGDFAGRKISLDIAGIGKTSDVRQIINTLLTHPERMPLTKNRKMALVTNKPTTDRIEFDLVMFDPHGGLSPATGIKIIPFVSGNQEKLNELQQKEKTLFEKMRKAIVDKKNEEKTYKLEEKAAMAPDLKGMQRARRIMRHLVPEVPETYEEW